MKMTRRYLSLFIFYHLLWFSLSLRIFCFLFFEGFSFSIFSIRVSVLSFLATVVEKKTRVMTFGLIVGEVNFPRLKVTLRMAYFLIRVETKTDIYKTLFRKTKWTKKRKREGIFWQG